MNNLMFVKPAYPDIQVRNPDRSGEHLPIEGAEVSRSSYWIRRLKDGDVVFAKKPKASAKTSNKE